MPAKPKPKRKKSTPAHKAKKSVRARAKVAAKPSKASRPGPKRAAKKATKRATKKPVKRLAAKKPAKRAAAPKPAKRVAAKKPARPAVAKPKATPTPRVHSAEFIFEAQHHSERADDARAFVRPSHGGGDEVAEELGEEYVQSATSGEEAGNDGLDSAATEENGGPFVPTNGREEFADGVDESNPEGTEPQAFPDPMNKPN